VVQALTQNQEQTLVFVPKIIAMLWTLVLALPSWRTRCTRDGAAFVANHRRVVQWRHAHRPDDSCRLCRRPSVVVRPHRRHGDAAAVAGTRFNIPVRIKLGIALLLTVIVLPAAIAPPSMSICKRWRRWRC